MPRFIPKNFVEDVSDKFTIAFSNTPGPIKPFFYFDNAGNKIQTT